MMWVFEFETEGETTATEKEIRKALDSGNGFCNGKAPEYIVRYKNKRLATPLLCKSCNHSLRFIPAFIDVLIFIDIIVQVL